MKKEIKRGLVCKDCNNKKDREKYKNMSIKDKEILKEKKKYIIKKVDKLNEILSKKKIIT